MSKTRSLTRYHAIKSPSSRYCVIALLSVLLWSCASPKVTKTPVKIAPKETVSSPILSTQESAQDILNHAQNLSETASTPEQAQQIDQLLLEASELFLDENNDTKALWLANKVSDLVDDNLSVFRLLLVKAQSLQQLNYSDEAFQQLQFAKTLVLKSQKEQQPISLNFNYYHTLSKVLASKSQPSAAISAQLFAFSLNTKATEQDVLHIWQQLFSLAPWQIRLIANDKPPFFNGWQQLLNTCHQFGDDQQNFSHHLSLWQQQFPTHPAGSIIETLKSNNLVIDKPENIAILLPLTGSQAKAGLATQQGILAAYNGSTIKLNFIDTNQLDWSTLPNQINQLAVDHIIGPLLKRNVDKFLSASQNESLQKLPTLLLNVTNNHVLLEHQFALSMRPEDEARQAAATLSKQHYKSPLILSHNDKVSKRIALKFRQQWQKDTDHNVEIVYFNDGQNMQTSLKTSLDVNTSQARINLLKSRLKQVIKSETRNRRDLDMIYIVGNAAQTRLIKPYIDVNTSAFAKVIPVYASSRSHSYFNDVNNKGSLNDLQNLTFTQMPWLLNSKQQNKSLAQLSQQIWPNRTDSLSRLFAMGYDSYHLVSKVELMQQAPYIIHYGQTGTLTLNKNNLLTRSLTWGRYQHNKVTEIAME